MRAGTGEEDGRLGGTISSWSSVGPHVASWYGAPNRGRIAAADRSREVHWTSRLPPLSCCSSPCSSGRSRDRPGTRWWSSVTRTGASPRLAERLARARGRGLAAWRSRPSASRDPRLRNAFSQLADRVADTWSLATVDPLTGIANRQAVLARLDEELAAREPVPPPAVGDHHRPRPLQAAQRRARPRGRRRRPAPRRAAPRGERPRRRHRGPLRRRGVPRRAARDGTPTRRRRWPRSCGGSSAGAEVRLPDGELVSVTLSAGVAGGQGEVLDLDALVRDADAALYSAKALGRDQVYVFRETGDEGTVRRAPISSEARSRALDVGRSAMDAAQDALIAALAGREAWSGKPSTMIAEASVALGRAVDLPNGELEPDPHREPAPRPRQARDPGRHPGPAGRPRDLRVAGRDRASQDRPGRAGAGGRAARRRDDRAPPPRVVRRPRLPARADRRRTSRSARGSCRSSTPTRR